MHVTIMFVCSRHKLTSRCAHAQHAYEFRPSDAEQMAKSRAKYDALLLRLQEEGPTESIVAELEQARRQMCWTCRSDLKRSQFGTTSATGQCYHYIRDLQANSKCIDCGESRHIEFDHINPEEEKKVHVVTDYVWWASHGSVDALKKEVGKCVPRCRNCHRKQSTSTHGKFQTLEEVDDAAQEEVWTTQRERNNKKQRTYKRKNAVRNRIFLKDFKLSYKQCAECSKEVTEDNYSAFDFAHIDGLQKSYAISELCSNHSLTLERYRHLVKSEANKCRLLCYECHRDECDSRRAKE